MAILGVLNLLLKADDTHFQKTLRGARAQLAREAKQWNKIGKSLTRSVTLPLVAMAAGAIKTSIDFEKAFAGVRKTVQANEEQFQQLEGQIRELAKAVPYTTTEIAKVVEIAGQLGVQRAGIMDFTKAVLDLGATTDLAGEQGAQSLARFMNIMQSAAESVRNLGSTLSGLDAASAASAGEIMEMGMRLAGAGKQVGMAEADVMGLAAALTSVGIKAESGGTAFSKVMWQLANAAASGGKKLEQFATIAGMSAKDFAAAWKADPAEALIAFVQGLRRLGDEGTNLFATLGELEMDNIRVADSLLRGAGAGKLFNEMLAKAREEYKANSALDKQASERYKTTAAQLKTLWNAVKDVALEVGNNLLPAVKAIVEFLKPVAEWLGRVARGFGELPPAVQKLYLGFVLLVALAGPIAKLVAGAIALARAILACRLAAGDWTAIIQIGLIAALTAATIGVGALASGVETLNGKMTTTAQRAREAADRLREAYGTPTFKVGKNGELTFGLERETPEHAEEHPEPAPSEEEKEKAIARLVELEMEYERARNEARSWMEAEELSFKVLSDGTIMLVRGAEEYEKRLARWKTQAKAAGEELKQLLSFDAERRVKVVPLKGVKEGVAAARRMIEDLREMGMAVADRIFEPLADAFVEMCAGAKVEWDKLLKHIMAALLKMAIELAVLNPIRNAFGNLFISTWSRGTLPTGTPYEVGPLITVYDQRTTPGAKPIETKMTGAGGKRTVELYIRDMVRGTVATGEVDDVFAQRFGMTPRRSY